ncbi:MAG: RNA-binding transcriptional accessory protein, partial [Bacteroidales bacterium]|nr:RNA-binding transcriptional accessory protein [Bacteroidales bacterium]
MNTLYVNYIANLISCKDWQVENCLQLLQDGATVPFISRYRKEVTGALDEVQVAQVKYCLVKFEELDKRKETVIASISDQGKLTQPLKEQIENCIQMQELEDLYLPYRPKRRTRASIAKERGLEPLATKMMSFNLPNFDNYVSSFINETLPDKEKVLSGARDIIAENLSERIEIRQELRNFYSRSSRLVSKLSKGKEEEGEKFENYFDFSEDLHRMPAHRLLAVLRGVSEGVLQVKLDADAVISKKIVNKFFYNGERCSSYSLFEQLDMAVDDSIKRLLHPSIENET